MIGSDINKAAELLKAGEIVAIPTETVYGLAANAFNDVAVTKVFEAKKRPSFDPLIVHTNSLEKVKLFVTHIPAEAKKLAEAIWPGPLTLILPKKTNIPGIVTSGNDTVGVRIPNHPLTLELLSLLDFPLAAPSANPFGYISPTTAKHVEAQLGNEVPYILDGGACEVGLESTIVSFAGDKPKVLRLGGLKIEQITEVIGEVDMQLSAGSNPQAPGQLDVHYAPSAKLILVENIEGELKKQGNVKDVGTISLSSYFGDLPRDNQIRLSPEGDINEAARNLFAAMRALDSMKLKIIIAEKMPEVGLGAAINDRLKRASV